ncbi:MAG TPA: SDR family NAD(P)-dependent oxidoreductase [Terriglobia bacterium]|nr:SDR family NAD(P)-dependent oxidoreductase [Terriglobia bacterium]
MEIRLDNQVVIITGGSRGIGAAAVKLFAECGSRVVFAYRSNAGAAEGVMRECPGESGRVIAVRADVSKMREARKLVDSAIRKFGRIDTLVANAGIWPADPLPIERMSEREWDEMIAINLKGVYTVVRHAVPHMIERQGGRIIVVSSTAGQRGESFHTHYGASKGGVISFVKGLSTELARHHILVNCVAPGWVDTDMCVPVLTEPREARRISSGIPLGRVARPDEVAMPILFLASEMASYITGEILNVNGGNVLCG